jgi:hypothetical protein
VKRICGNLGSAESVLKGRRPALAVDRDSRTRTGARAPGVERRSRLNGGSCAHSVLRH